MYESGVILSLMGANVYIMGVCMRVMGANVYIMGVCMRVMSANVYIMGVPDDDIEDNNGLRLANVVEIIGAFFAAEEISILAYRSEVFLQSKHLHRSEHGTKAVKHSQYFLRQALFLQ